MLAQRHVREIQQPASTKIIRLFAELFHQELNGAPRATRDLVEAARLDGHGAGSRGVIEQAVFLFAKSQISDCRIQSHQRQLVRREIYFAVSDELPERLELSDRGLAFAGMEQFVRVLVA